MGINPPRKNFASSDSRKVTGITFLLFVCLFLKLLWYQCSCPSSWCPNCFLREDLSKTTVWRSSQVLRRQPMKKNGNRGEYSSSAALNWAVFLFRCSSSSFITVFLLKKKVFCLKPAKVTNVMRCVKWGNQVFVEDVTTFCLYRPAYRGKLNVFVFFNHHLHLPCLTRETNASDQKSKLENVISQL